MTTNSKIDIIVQSKYLQVLEEFRKEIAPTISHFQNVRIVEFTGDRFGAKAINEQILQSIKEEVVVVGILNDDLWFSGGWLDNVISHMDEYLLYSPGYVETKDKEVFSRAVEQTKNETGVVPLFYGPAGFYRTDIFKKIGWFDEQFDWSCDDMDWALRAHLHHIKQGTSRKITIGHQVGISLTNMENRKHWNELSTLNKERFYKKHGYVGYREIRRTYKNSHLYFVKFR